MHRENVFIIHTGLIQIIIFLLYSSGIYLQGTLDSNLCVCKYVLDFLIKITGYWFYLRDSMVDDDERGAKYSRSTRRLLFYFSHLLEKYIRRLKNRYVDISHFYHSNVIVVNRECFSWSPMLPNINPEWQVGTTSVNRSKFKLVLGKAKQA